MLNKEACKKCCTDYGDEWEAVDERRWKRDYAYCPKTGVGWIAIVSEPPETCRYQLEHAVGNIHAE